MKLSGVLCLIEIILLSFSTPARALTPPRGDETTCYVEGKVLAHEQQEAADLAMNPLAVEGIVLEIHEIRPLDEAYRGEFCQGFTGVKGPDGHTVSAFRLCDETDARDGTNITGVVGRSLGGGPYCIEQIAIIE